MSKDLYFDFAQLWRTEQLLLAEIATSVPDNGTIVEVGTAQGGSALIFNETTKHRGVKIYSFDIAPSAYAYERLQGTNVTIIPKSSIEGALSWKEAIGKPIDLLFIDGSHALHSVFEDFNAWVTFLGPKGKIIFHDYDSVERGGLVHLAVRVCLDTILRLGLLEEWAHQDRILHGTVSQQNKTHLDAHDCCRTFADLGNQIARVRNADYRGWTIVGDEQFTKLLMGGLAMDDKAVPITPAKAKDPHGKHLVFHRPLVAALDSFREYGLPKDSIVIIDNLTACYILDHIQKKDKDYLLKLTASTKEFLKWEEMLFMFEHAFGVSRFPDEVPNPSAGLDIAQLSRMVAREQVRLNILASLLKICVGWLP